MTIIIEFKGNSIEIVSQIHAIEIYKDEDDLHYTTHLH